MATLTTNTSIQQLNGYLLSNTLSNNITLANISAGDMIGNALDLLANDVNADELGSLNPQGTHYVYQWFTEDTNEPLLIATITGSGFSLSTDPISASKGLLNEDDHDWIVNSFDVQLLATHGSVNSLARVAFAGSIVVSADVLTSGLLTSFSIATTNGASFEITGPVNYDGINLTSAAATLTWAADSDPADGAPSPATLRIDVANLVLNNTSEAGIVTAIYFDDNFSDIHFALTGASIDLALFTSLKSTDLVEILNLAGADVSDLVSASSDYILPATSKDLTLIGTENISGTGNDLSNVIAGNSGDNNLFGLNGNDFLYGWAGNDMLDGGSGIDTAMYSGNLADYSLTKTGSTYTVRADRGTDGADTLIDIERLLFSDTSVALDMGVSEAGGETALLLGVCLGTDGLSDKSLVGGVLSYFDAGHSLQDATEFLVSTGVTASLAGGADNKHFVNWVYDNVIGGTPSAPVESALLSYLTSGAFTQATFLSTVAELEINQIHVGLIGLQQTGMEYIA